MTPTKLKKTQRKIMLNSGQGYTYKTGQNMKGKKVGEIIKVIAPKRLNLLVIKLQKNVQKRLPIRAVKKYSVILYFLV